MNPVVVWALYTHTHTHTLQIPVSVRAAGTSTAGRRQWQQRHKRGQWIPKNKNRKNKSNFDV